MMRWKKHYRIVVDNYAGYEVQVWRPWFPFWTQANGTNTHLTVERAEQYAHLDALHSAGKVIKYLGVIE
jgi:hypothetical protein